MPSIAVAAVLSIQLLPAAVASLTEWLVVAAVLSIQLLPAAVASLTE